MFRYIGFYDHWAGIANNIIATIFVEMIFFLRKDTRYVVKLQLISPLPSIVCAPLKKETVEVLI